VQSGEPAHRVVPCCSYASTLERQRYRIVISSVTVTSVLPVSTRPPGSSTWAVSVNVPAPVPARSPASASPLESRLLVRSVV
jgi:hypothetical protein